MSDKIAYTVAEAAEQVSVSDKTIRRAIADGDLAVRYAGAKRRVQLIARDELLGWFNALPSERAS